MKNLTAEEIADQICGLEERTKNAALKEVIEELEDFRKQGPGPYGSEDDWDSGFADAIGTIRENWSVK